MLSISETPNTAATTRGNDLKDLAHDAGNEHQRQKRPAANVATQLLNRRLRASLENSAAADRVTAGSQLARAALTCQSASLRRRPAARYRSNGHDYNPDVEGHRKQRQ